jgi:transglutaminase-like putative cysteine protease
VRIDPEARLIQHHDYFGTHVVEFGISRPHSRLTIDVRAKVETMEPPEPVETSWDREIPEEGAEYLLPMGDEPANGALADLAREVRGESPLETVTRVTELIPDRFEYQPGVTYVGSTVQDMLTAGGGVCQDFAHLALILLRRNGIPARYVSGYLFAAPSEGDDSAEVNTHAWVEALIQGGWVGIDPTNRRRAGEDHVKIGHGRRYGDVPPIKGVYRGAASATLEAGVKMTRLDSP